MRGWRKLLCDFGNQSTNNMLISAPKNVPLGHVHHSLPQEIKGYNLLHRKKNKTNKIAYTNYTFKFEESFL